MRSTCKIICCLASKSTAADNTSSRQDTRLGQSSHPQMKLSSVWRLMLVILCRRSKRVGLVSFCVWRWTEHRSENAKSSSWDLLYFAGVESRVFLRGHPTPLTTAVATGPATVEYKQPRMYTCTAHVVAPPPLIRDVLPFVGSLGDYQNIRKLWWRWVEYEHERSLWMEASSLQ